MHIGFRKVNYLILLAIILMVGVSFNSCSESPFKPVNPDPDPDPESSIIGTWGWRVSCGGLAGVCIYADSVDYSRTWEFKEEYVVVRRNDSVLYASPYEIVRKPFWYWDDGDTVDVLLIDGLPEMMIETLNADTLELIEGCSDCFGSVFVRQIEVEPDPLGPLFGTWDWRQSCGGGFYECFYADSGDYTISYTFESDYVVMRRNDSLISIEPFAIVIEPMDYSSDTTDVLEILFNDGLMVHRAELPIGDTLRFFDRFVDEISQCWCYDHLYVRRP